MLKEKQVDLCLVCRSPELEPLLFGYSPLFPRLFHRTAVCKDCGHIQLYPLLTEEECTVINNRFFEKQYMVDGVDSAEGNLMKERRTDERLRSYLRDGLNVLDVGAGEAWAMDYFKQNNCHYFAIEAVDKLASSIQERGGEVIGKSIFDDHSRYESKFDIIIFRHILEHLLNPAKALSVLKSLLGPDGLIYLALPNAFNPSIHKGFRTSYIRPVHISYFCEGNVLRLAQSVGLRAILSESIGELFCLLKHGGIEEPQYENYYIHQKDIFLKKAQQAMFKDLLKIIKNLPLTLTRRLLHSMRIRGI